jgi:acetylornithine deacetylase/succinyl-diaminopimelate desuccinylase-like protein
MKPIQHVEAHFDDYVGVLKRLCQIPSVSFANHDPVPLTQCAKAIASLFLERGVRDVEVIQEGSAHPTVVAKTHHNPSKPTLLMYSHYDVQPIGEESKWISPAFEPTVRGGRLYARGSSDDKAGFVAQFAALDAFLQTHTELPVNLIFLVEGEEEIGSVHLQAFMHKHLARFASTQALVITDTELFDTGKPGITHMLRGIVAFQVELKVLRSSLHSGMWGGPTPDAAMAMSKLLGTLVDREGRIAIPEIAEGVNPLSAEHQEDLKHIAPSEETFRKQAGLLEGVSLLQRTFPILESLWYRPSLVVTAMQASSRAKAGNILCDHAWARITLRTVPPQKSERCYQLLVDHLKRHVPWGAHLAFEAETLADPWVMPSHHPVLKLAKEAMTQAFHCPARLVGCGGSIPIVDPLTQALGGVPAVLFGLSDPYSAAHSENESMHLGDLKATIQSLVYFFQKVGENNPFTP